MFGAINKYTSSKVNIRIKFEMKKKAINHSMWKQEKKNDWKLRFAYYRMENGDRKKKWTHSAATIPTVECVTSNNNHIGALIRHRRRNSSSQHEYNLWNAINILNTCEPRADSALTYPFIGACSGDASNSNPIEWIGEMSPLAFSQIECVQRSSTHISPGAIEVRLAFFSVLDEHRNWLIGKQ